MVLFAMAHEILTVVVDEKMQAPEIRKETNAKLCNKIT